MRVKHTLVTMCSFAVLIASSPLDAGTLIHAGRLIDGVSDATRTKVTIMIEGDRISEILDGYAPPKAGDEVIEMVSFVMKEGVVYKSN